MMGPITRTVTKLSNKRVAGMVGGASGPAGIAMGLALPYVARALGPAGMVSLAIGGWVVGRLIDRQAERKDRSSRESTSGGAYRP